MVLNYIAQFSVNYPLLFLLIIIIASLVILLKAADFLVLGVTNYAERLGISDYLIGLIVVSLGASLPELVSSIMGSIAEESGIIFGTIIGSNIVGLTLVLGALAIVGKKIKMKIKMLKKTKPVIFVLGMLPFVFVFIGYGRISRIEGGLLLAVWAGYNIYLWKKEREAGGIKKQVKLERIYRDALIAVFALLAIILSGRWLVFSTIEISKMFGVTPYLLSLIVIGIAAQVPDFAVSIRAILQGHQDVAFADILGSLITKSLLFFGVFALIKPLVIDPLLLIVGIIFLAAALALTLYFAKREILTWKGGIVLIVLYGLFIFIELITKWF